MRRGRHIKPERQDSPSAAPPEWRQGLIAVGVIQHPSSGYYQVWLHARDQTAMLLAFRTLEQADAAKQAVGEALLRGEHATPERWVAALAAIRAEGGIEVEPVSNDVFAAIRAQIQNAELMPPEASLHEASAAADAPAAAPPRIDSSANVPAKQR